jgi:6-phosphogluconolactonase
MGFPPPLEKAGTRLRVVGEFQNRREPGQMANGQSSSRDIMVCSSVNALSLDAANRFTALSSAATRRGKPFTVALAGGHTPAQLYRLLGSTPFKEAIDWEQVHLFFGDERCVPVDSPFSNFRMARETLIDPVAVPSANVHRIRAEQTDPETAAAEYAAELVAFFSDAPFPSFDLILLGMGADGHCASLFPNKAALSETERWVVQSEPGLEPFVPRVTLTLPVLNNAANVLFLVAGADKSAAAARVLTGPPMPDNLPSQSVRPLHGALTWLLDRSAASGLQL